MSEVRRWLEGIGLGQYAEAFEANALDMDLLPQVDDQMLKDIGVWAAGHRLRFRNAIAQLTATPEPKASVAGSATENEPAAPSAERRQPAISLALGFAIFSR